MAEDLEKDSIEFPPWYGELGWEIASWAPLCRKAAEGYENVQVSSFADSAALYADFATEFVDHGQKQRGLTYRKLYRPKGKYFKYGNKENVPFQMDVLIHARGIRRKCSINYRHWPEFQELAEKLPFTFAVIGSFDDQKLPGLFDLRNLELSMLMDQIAAAKLVIGVSSGIMHLAAFCGTDIVCWGDRRTYFGETLEKRYKMTWNPFNVKVGWIEVDDFQPGPEQIIERIGEILL